MRSSAVRRKERASTPYTSPWEGTGLTAADEATERPRRASPVHIWLHGGTEMTAIAVIMGMMTSPASTITAASTVTVLTWWSKNQFLVASIAATTATANHHKEMTQVDEDAGCRDNRSTGPLGSGTWGQGDTGARTCPVAPKGSVGAAEGAPGSGAAK